MSTNEHQYGRLIEYGHVPCFICKPKTLAECGHPIDFMDDEWLAEESKRTCRELGRRLAYEREMRTLNMLLTEDSLTPGP